MSNFFSYLNSANETKKGKETPVQDKAPKGKALTGGYFVFCRDQDGTLRRLIEAIGKHGNGGHSYDIVLDPDRKEERESFCWDGDGSDYIKSIIAIPEGEGDDNPLIRMCLQTLDSIKWQAEEMLSGDDTGEDPEPSKEQMTQTFKDIVHDASLLLKGYKFDNEARNELVGIREYCDNILTGLKNDYFREWHKDLTMEKALTHIKEMCDNALPEKPTQR